MHTMCPMWYFVVPHHFVTDAHNVFHVIFRRTSSLCDRCTQCVPCDISSSLCLLFASCVMTQQNATFLRALHLGGYDPQFELGRDFCAMHLPPSFVILYLLVWKLSCWQTNKHTHTHKQTPLKTSNVLSYATTLGNYLLVCLFICYQIVRSVNNIKNVNKKLTKSCTVATVIAVCSNTPV